ncbi:MAG: glycosyltransferase [Chloroflexi bacterium]|nr:glycosyltransferase [Chloroflexota bacterium]
MSAPLPGDPLYAFPPRDPLPPGGPVRVVELLATGTNGGAQEHVYGLLSRLDRERYSPTVVSLSPGASARRIASLGVPTLILDEPDDAIAVGALAAHLADLRPDVLHSHMYRAELVGTRAALALAQVGRRRPYVVSTVHSSRVRSAEDRAELRRLTPHIDQLIAVSVAIEEKIRHEERVGAPVRLVYNGVDLHRYDHQEPCCTLREEYGIEAGAPIVGVVARLEPEKGHRTLLDAWPLVLRRAPDARLLVVGEGSLLTELVWQARELGIDRRVVFAGRRDDIPAVTAALDVAALPSYREAQGMVILEAMALSRPVVATNVGGIPEMIEDGVSGLLVPPHDPDALAEAIIRLLVDHPFADTIARNGHDLAHARFSIEFMVRAIEDIYDEGARAVRLRDAVAV